MGTHAYGYYQTKWFIVGEFTSIKRIENFIKAKQRRNKYWIYKVEDHSGLNVNLNIGRIKNVIRKEKSRTAKT